MMLEPTRAVVCLCLCLSAWRDSGVSGVAIPQEMNRTIQNLLQHYKLLTDEHFSGTPVFPKEPLSAKMEFKAVFMTGVLETYEKLIDHMLKQLPTPSAQTAGVTNAPGDPNDPAAIRKDLIFIQGKLRKLRTEGYPEQYKLLRGLNELRHIKMDNSLVQKKSLRELLWFYSEAVELYRNLDRERKRRRRRRQAWIKSRPRA